MYTSHGNRYVRRRTRNFTVNNGCSQLHGTGCQQHTTTPAGRPAHGSCRHGNSDGVGQTSDACVGKQKLASKSCVEQMRNVKAQPRKHRAKYCANGRIKGSLLRTVIMCLLAYGAGVRFGQARNPWPGQGNASLDDPDPEDWGGFDELEVGVLDEPPPEPPFGYDDFDSEPIDLALSHHLSEEVTGFDPIPAFRAVKAFAGKISGTVYKTGPSGLGYYGDTGVIPISLATCIPKGLPPVPISIAAAIGVAEASSDHSNCRSGAVAA